MATAAPTSPDPPGAHLGPIELAPGISRANGLTLFYSAFTAIGLLAFVSVGTPYVLNVYLHIPMEDQGRIAGDLAAWNEVTLLLIFGPCGILADRIGRREVFAVGFLMMGLGYALYPWAESVGELTLYRVIYAVGIGAATAMLQTLVADYPAERTRGRAVAITGIMNGLGVITLTVGLGGLMKTFEEGGQSAEAAGYIVHSIVAGLCVVSAVVVLWGLKKGTPAKRHERPPIGELIRSGFAEARNPRIALAYACAFIARGDLVVVGTFVNLWGTTAGLQAGLDPGTATAKGRMLFGIASVAALIWLPVMGLLLDRVNRVTGTAVAMTLAGLGFLFMDMVEDPLLPPAFIFFALLGVGQISAFAGAATLIGQEAPLAKRGAVVGMFNISGAVGILFATSVGGRLFDSVGPHAPFELIGILTIVTVIFAVIVRWKSPGPPFGGRGGGFAAH
jgi:MFS family permease